MQHSEMWHFFPLQETKPEAKQEEVSDSPEVQALFGKVAAQGDTVRKLKQSKASKEEIDAAVKVNTHSTDNIDWP